MSDIKLLHGDSYKLIKDIPDKSVDLVYIDIPYEKTKENGYYSCGGTFGVSGRDYQRTLRDKGLMDGIKTSILDQITRVMKHIYIYMV